MIVQPIIAILLATPVATSGAVGSFYFASAQEQAAVDNAEITVDKQAQPGYEIDVGGSNFGANSDVSIYFMSSARANLTNGSAFIMQEVPANEITAAAAPGGGHFFGDALSALEGLFGMNNGSTTTSSNVS